MLAKHAYALRSTASCHSSKRTIVVVVFFSEEEAESGGRECERGWAMGTL